MVVQKAEIVMPESTSIYFTLTMERFDSVTGLKDKDIVVTMDESELLSNKSNIESKIVELQKQLDFIDSVLKG